MADLHGYFHGFFQGREGVPVPVVRPENIGKQGFVGPHGDGVGGHVLGADIYRSAQGDAQTLALAQGVADSALVGAHSVSGQVQITARGIVLPGVALQEGGVISVGDEADVLTVPLPGVAETHFLGDGPDLLLGQFPQGKADVGELMLAEAGEEIALVLGAVHSLAKKIVAGIRVPADPGVMSCNHPVEAQVQGLFQQSAEFQLPVADDAGIGGGAGFVAADKVLQNPVPELGLKIKYFKGHIQALRNTAGVFRIVMVAFSLCVKAHGNACTGDSGAFCQIGGDRTVHTAAHADQGFSCFHSHPPFLLSITGQGRKVNAKRLTEIVTI